MFPLLTTSSRVVATELVVIELMRPFESTVMTGTAELDPYVSGVALVVHVSCEAFPE